MHTTVIEIQSGACSSGDFHNHIKLIIGQYLLAKFVHHLSGWYAQKHPDDDFTETFAVWLIPNSEWQKLYSNTPALAKLLFIDRIARKYGQKPPD